MHDTCVVSAGRWHVVHPAVYHVAVAGQNPDRLVSRHSNCWHAVLCAVLQRCWRIKMAGLTTTTVNTVLLHADYRTRRPRLAAESAG